MATPVNMSAPQIASRFVHQYYHTLHDAPHELHRFYKDDSSFSHEYGTDEQVSTGQKAIQQKIQDLDFSDCKVNVSTIDSQTSVNGAILIIVLGSMSNKGTPFRRFTHTFVLAPQRPSGFYVMNDVFRHLTDRQFNEGAEEQTAVSAHATASPVPAASQPQKAEHKPAVAPATAAPVAASQAPAKADDHAAPKERKRQEKPQEKQAAATTSAAAATTAAATASAATAPATAAPATAAATPATAAAPATGKPAKNAKPSTWASLLGGSATAAAAAGADATSGAPRPREQRDREQREKREPREPRGDQQQRDREPRGDREQRERRPRPAVSGDEAGASEGEKGFGGVEGGFWVFINRCPLEASEQAVRAALEKFGPIATMDYRRRRPHQFAQYASPADGQKLLAAGAKGGVKIDGAEVQVDVRKPLPPRPRPERGPRSDGERSPQQHGDRAERGPRPPRADGDQRPPRTDRTDRPRPPRAEGDREQRGPRPPRADGDREQRAPRADGDQRPRFPARKPAVPSPTPAAAV